MAATGSAGFLIYEGVMPLLKTYITIIMGYALARMGLFPPAASRGSSQVSMNVALPCLIFANIVPAFTPSNISAIGPLILVASIYIVCGFVIGYIIREVCYVPRNFWQGIIICAGMSNWGNLPTSIVQSVTQHSPFDGSTDIELGISYVSIFIMVYHIVFWVLGAAASLSWDYRPDVPQGEEAMKRVPWYEKPIGGWIYRLVKGRHGQTGSGLLTRIKRYSANSKISEKKSDIANDNCVTDLAVLETGAVGPTAGTSETQQAQYIDPDIQLARRVSRLSAVHHVHDQSELTSQTQTHTTNPQALSAFHNCSETTLPLAQDPASPLAKKPKFSSWCKSLFPQWFIRAVQPLLVIVTPVTVALAISLPVSVIQPLKALFTDATVSGGPDWKGPDGSPPLHFVMDTATFVGDLCIPLSLIVLGGSFARMNLPRSIRSLPIPAMVLVTISKEVVVPIIGIFTVQGLVTKGLIPKEALAQRFVAMFLSGTPAAVNQLIVASLYAPEGGLDTLTAFLAMQYICMLFTSTALTAIALSLL